MVSLKNTIMFHIPNLYQVLLSIYSPQEHLPSTQPQTCSASSVPSPSLRHTISSRKPHFFPLIHVPNFYMFFRTPIQGLTPQVNLLWFFQFYVICISFHSISLPCIVMALLFCVAPMAVHVLGERLSFFCGSVSISPFLAHQGAWIFIRHVSMESLLRRALH